MILNIITTLCLDFIAMDRRILRMCVAFADVHYVVYHCSRSCLDTHIQERPMLLDEGMNHPRLQVPIYPSQNRRPSPGPMRKATRCPTHS